MIYLGQKREQTYGISFPDNDTSRKEKKGEKKIRPKNIFHF